MIHKDSSFLYIYILLYLYMHSSRLKITEEYFALQVLAIALFNVVSLRVHLVTVNTFYYEKIL